MLNNVQVVSLYGYKDINFIAFMIIRTLFNKGSRVPLRGKVNEAVTTGVRVVDTILPIGRGQRQLITMEIPLMYKY